MYDAANVCPSPPSIPHAKTYRCSSRYDFSSMCKYTCDTGYHTHCHHDLKVGCDADGTWNRTTASGCDGEFRELYPLIVHVSRLSDRIPALTASVLPLHYSLYSDLVNFSEGNRYGFIFASIEHNYGIVRYWLNYLMMVCQPMPAPCHGHAMAHGHYSTMHAYN